MGSPHSSGVVGGDRFREIARMRLELMIDGMVAVHAKYAVFQALAAVDGITRAEVEMGRVALELDREPDEQQLHDVITAVGFALREIRRLPRALPML